MNNSVAQLKPRIVVYSAIFGGYDAVFPIKSKDANVDHVLISDGDVPRGSGWTLQRPPAEVATFDAGGKNRWCKFFPQRIFPDYDVSVYVDGNIQLLTPINPLLLAFQSKGVDLGLFKHPERQSITEELEACLAPGKLSAEAAQLVSERLVQYEASADLVRRPLTENGVLFRRHASPALDDAMVLWWEEFQRVGRDQIALPWVLQQSPIEVAVWDWSYRNANSWFLGPIIPHLGNLPSGVRGRIKLFLKHQKVQRRNHRAAQDFDPQEAAGAFL